MWILEEKFVSIFQLDLGHSILNARWTLVYLLYQHEKDKLLIGHLQVVNLLLTSFERAERDDFHKLVLQTLASVFIVVFENQDEAGFQALHSVRPLQRLLGRFNQLSYSNRVRVLRLVTHIWSRVSLNTEDLAAYCGLLRGQSFLLTTRSVPKRGVDGCRSHGYANEG